MRLNLLVESGQLGESIRNLLGVRLSVEPHVLSFLTPEVSVRFQDPIDVERLVHVVIEVVPVAASQEAQDGVRLVKHLAFIGFLPDGNLARDNRRLDLGPLLEGNDAVVVGDALLREEHTDRLGLGVQREVRQGAQTCVVGCLLGHLSFFLSILF